MVLQTAHVSQGFRYHTIRICPFRRIDIPLFDPSRCTFVRRPTNGRYESHSLRRGTATQLEKGVVVVAPAVNFY